MPHTLIKFITRPVEGEIGCFSKLTNGRISGEEVSYIDARSWHLPTELGDGESTACGQVYADYDRETKEVNKGGITCPDCLKEVKFFKSINL